VTEDVNANEAETKTETVIVTVTEIAAVHVIVAQIVIGTRIKTETIRIAIERIRTRTKTAIDRVNAHQGTVTGIKRNADQGHALAHHALAAVGAGKFCIGLGGRPVVFRSAAHPYRTRAAASSSLAFRSCGVLLRLFAVAWWLCIQLLT